MHFCGKCKKVKFCYYLTFLTGAKHWGGIPDKKFYNETKILSGIWIADHGRDNRRHEIADFNCIDNLERWQNMIGF